MSTVLITGGAGFIGSHITEMLVDSGFNVLVVDNLRTGRLKNLEAILNKIKVIQIDIRDREKIEEIIKEADIIIHMAAVVNLQDFYEHPVEGFDVNVNATIRLLELARKHEVELFEFASSAAVYGEPKYLPVDEDHPARPLHPYGASKLAGEQIGMTYYHTYGLKFIGFRIFNVYGPRMTGGFYAGVIYKFVKAALQGEPLTIFGSGEQTRDFIFVKDIALGFLAGIKNQVPDVYNLGTGKSISINKLAEMIVNMANSKSSIVHTAPRPGDIMHSRANIEKAVKILGWKPKFDIEEGLKETIESMRRSS